MDYHRMSSTSEDIDLQTPLAPQQEKHTPISSRRTDSEIISALNNEQRALQNERDGFHGLTSQPKENIIQTPISSQTGFVPQINMSLPVGPRTSKVVCPSCRSTVSTKVIKEATMKTHAMACLCCICCCCCTWLPYCKDNCNASNHYCPSCDAFLGTYDH